MRKGLLLCIAIGILGLCACSGAKETEASAVWDCSVVAVEDNTSDTYVITYSSEEIFPQTGQLTIQNQNDFPIVVHLQTPGEKELVGTIQPGGYWSQRCLKTDVTYTIGVHAEVSAGTEIVAMVYDGTNTQPY